jgi:hypothetical protein
VMGSCAVFLALGGREHDGGHRLIIGRAQPQGWA